MSIANDIILGLRDMEWATGSNSLTWKGTTYVCTPSSLMRSSNLGIGNFDIDIDLRLLVRKALFTHVSSLPWTADDTTHTVDETVWGVDGSEFYPSAGDKITYGGVDYFVVSATSDATGSFIDMACTDGN